jgi:hypothetical protein
MATGVCSTSFDRFAISRYNPLGKSYFWGPALATWEWADPSNYEGVSR